MRTPLMKHAHHMQEKIVHSINTYTVTMYNTPPGINYSSQIKGRKIELLLNSETTATGNTQSMLLRATALKDGIHCTICIYRVTKGTQ